MDPKQFTIPKFNSQTGEGTLSGIARQHNTTVQGLLDANKDNRDAIPDINNPDLIREGASLNIPGGDPEVLRTTTNQRAETAGRLEDLSAQQERLAETNGEVTADTTVAPLPDGGVQKTTDIKAEEQTPEQIEIASIEDRAVNDINRVNQSLDSLKGQFDSSTDALLESIQLKYTNRIEEMKVVNRRQLATKEQIGFRTGRARFITGVQEGILTDEELAGIARISKLEGEMLGLAIEAESARAKNNLAIFNDRFDKLEDVRDRTQKEIANQHKLVTDAEDQRLKREKAERDVAAAEFEQGLERASIAAPALAVQLAGLGTTEERVDFLQEYSQQTGIPLDIVLGEIQSATTAQQKSSLDIRNLESQIRTRESKETRLSEEDVDEETEFVDAEQFVTDNPDSTDAEIKQALLRDSNLSVSQVNSILATRPINDLVAQNAARAIATNLEFDKPTLSRLLPGDQTAAALVKAKEAAIAELEQTGDIDGKELTKDDRDKIIAQINTLTIDDF